MASSWILFFSYQDDVRSETHQIIRDIITNGISQACKLSVFLIRYFNHAEFPRKIFEKILQYEVSGMSVHREPSMFHADVQTGMTKLRMACGLFGSAIFIK